MVSYKGLQKQHKPNWQGLINNILRKGTPSRVHHIELFHDEEVRAAIAENFDLDKKFKLNPNDPDYSRRQYIAFQRFLGFDHISVNLVDVDFEFHQTSIKDTAELGRKSGRLYMDEHAGPITNWQEFEKYKWPDPTKPSATRELEWYQKNLPDDMCIITHTGHFAEMLSWLMGYETLCLALYDHRELVEAIADRTLQYHVAECKQVLQFDRVKALWGSDDMGFRNGLLISPDDTRKLCLTGHKVLAKMAHDAGMPYLLHSCGKLDDIYEDLIEDVKLDAKHSFEDTIEDCRDAKKSWGRRMAMLGGIDVDFLCRSDEQAIRARVRDTLDKCMPGGGYCLGTGNSVANYIPLENYLVMVDEGRLYS